MLSNNKIKTIINIKLINNRQIMIKIKNISNNNIMRKKNWNKIKKITDCCILQEESRSVKYFWFQTKVKSF